MNYLAHAYLSFERPALTVGNLISDFVKGKRIYDYPDPIRQGMVLHRRIDSFTDIHPLTREAAAFFKPAYGLYAAAFIDIVFDHFLATDSTVFTEESLLGFSQTTYSVLQDFEAFHPPAFARVFPSMRKYNWLFNYRYTAGIERSFEGLVYRAKYMDDLVPAIHIFKTNYEALEKIFRAFFPSLEAFAREELGRMESETNNQTF